MVVNKEALRQLMEKEAPGKKSDGNYNEFARALRVAPAQLYRILNGESLAGSVFLGKLMSFCIIKGLDFQDYIFLDVPLSVEKG